MNGHYSLNRNEYNLRAKIVVYNDQLQKFISNLYYFKKKLKITSYLFASKIL
jgi:hypothetical protein